MGEIKLDTHNYRVHDERNLKLIKKSLKDYGAGRSILIDADGEIIAGNATYKTAQELGIPVEVIKTDGKKIIALQREDLHTQDRARKELALVDNTSSDKPNWDWDTINVDFKADELPALGIEDLPETAQLDAEVVEDEVPNAEDVETRVKKGDIWQLGEHRLMCGDSTVITDVEKLMNGEKADMVFTDPPYGVNASGGRQQTKNKLGMKAIENDDLSGSELEKFLSDFISVMKYKSEASIYICYPWATQEEFTKAIKQNNLKIKNCIIWDKKVFGLNGFKGYRPQYEMIYFCCKDDFEWYGDKSQSNIWQISREIKREEQGNHPTPKPIELISRALVNSSKKEDCIYDAFGGSGSTLIACEQLKRKCRMMELDEHYCDVIIQRWENLTGKQAVRL